jgi:hypothetical protein
MPACLCGLSICLSKYLINAKPWRRKQIFLYKKHLNGEKVSHHSKFDLISLDYPTGKYVFQKYASGGELGRVWPLGYIYNRPIFKFARDLMLTF